MVTSKETFTMVKNNNKIMIARSLVHLALLMLHFIINSHAKSINYAMVPSHVSQLPASLHKGTKDALLITLVIQNPTWQIYIMTELSHYVIVIGANGFVLLYIWIEVT